MRSIPVLTIYDLSTNYNSLGTDNITVILNNGLQR